MALSEAEELELLELERARHFAMAKAPTAPIEQAQPESPTFMQGLKAGALDQPAPQAEHWYSPAAVGHFVGEAALPTAGAIVGSVVPGYGTAVGAAAGEAAKKAIGRGYEAASGKEFKDESAARTITDVAAAGALQKAGEVATPILSEIGGKALSWAGAKSRPILAGLVKVLTGVDERTAKRVLADPDILLRAKPMEQAEKEFGDFVKSSGFKYAEDGVKAATGSPTMGNEAADKFITNVAERIKSITGTNETGMTSDEIMSQRWLQRAKGQPEGAIDLKDMPENKEFVNKLTQDALAARYAIKDSIKRALREGSDTKARYFINARKPIDSWLEGQLPGFKNALSNYSESKAADAFKSFLPVNKAGDPSVLRSLSMLGLVLSDVDEGLTTAALGSPLITGTAIKGAAIAGKVASPVGKAVESITSKSGAALTPLIERSPNDVKQDYKSGKITREQALKELRETHGFK